VSEWPRHKGVTCVECPDCAFCFDADHTDAGTAGEETYSCPQCAQSELATLIEAARRVDATVREGEEEQARQRAADPSYKPPYAGTIDSTIYLLNVKASAYRIVRALAAHG
jgi:hypothetical protein